MFIFSVVFKDIAVLCKLSSSNLCVFSSQVVIFLEDAASMDQSGMVTCMEFFC